MSKYYDKLSLNTNNHIYNTPGLDFCIYKIYLHKSIRPVLKREPFLVLEK